MLGKRFVPACCLALAIGLTGCSRQQSDWQTTRESNTPEAYEQFVKKYPSGEFTAQAQARLKELYDDRDWQKARDADTPEAYQAYLNQYPEGQSATEARNRLENFTLAKSPAGTHPAPGSAPIAPGGTLGSLKLGPRAEGAPSAPPPSAPPPAAPPPAAKSGTAAASSAPAPHQAPPVAAAMAPAHARHAASNTKVAPGDYALQLGAFRSGSAAANKHWERLQKEYPNLLAGLNSRVVPKRTASGTLYRLQTVGLTESHARKICRDLKAKSQPCLIVRVERG
jgi:cell division septation protein DedD